MRIELLTQDHGTAFGLACPIPVSRSLVNGVRTRLTVHGVAVSLDTIHTPFRNHPGEARQRKAEVDEKEESEKFRLGDHLAQ